MRARTFEPQFAPMVARKVKPKRQTIRPLPKRMPKVGAPESWREWTGAPYRSKQRELAQVELTGVTPIRLEKINDPQGMGTEYNITVPPEHAHLLPQSMTEFAMDDGFANIAAMFEFFERKYSLPFEGILIKAKTFEPNTAGVRPSTIINQPSTNQ